MCPACFASIAIYSIGATSTGGLAALAMKKFRLNKKSKLKSIGVKNESTENCVAK